MTARAGLYVMALGLHGLVRSKDIELGRDADTGGQTLYMIEEAGALAANPAVERVDLVTRLIDDKAVSRDYAAPEEVIAGNTRILRIPFGPRRYLRKENLWPHLDSLVDHLMRDVRRMRRSPDVIHAHYADAGYVGSRLARILGVPLVFTGHSLGRVKRQRLLDEGMSTPVIEDRYHIARRIEGEEQALETASVVIASTNQEVEEQYALYTYYQPGRMNVIPPGVDIARFGAQDAKLDLAGARGLIEPFLKDVRKPMVLAIARADVRKNLPTLVRAFGRTPGLRERANLVMVAGSRTRLGELDTGARKVVHQILNEVDDFDLYGSVAHPKHLPVDLAPALYRLAALSRGVFVNPALTEPFGLTLLEAAANGLPVVATSDGGPRDILRVCRNGELVDPFDADEMGRIILDTITNQEAWSRKSENARRGAAQFSWSAHAERYVEVVGEVLEGNRPAILVAARSRLPQMDRALVSDLDGTLTGDDESLHRLLERIREAGESTAFGIVTGRGMEECRQVLSGIPVRRLDFLLTDSGTEIRYGWPDAELDRSWSQHIAHHWKPTEIRRALEGVPGIEARPETESGSLRIACTVDPQSAPSLASLRKHLRQRGLRATVVFDSATRMDVLPVRASPGLALRFLEFKLDLAPDRTLVAGDSGNDADMLTGNTLGVVVANHKPEISFLRAAPRVYFARAPHAAGVLEGIDYYDFFGSIRIPQEEQENG